MASFNRSYLQPLSPDKVDLDDHRVPARAGLVRTASAADPFVCRRDQSRLKEDPESHLMAVASRGILGFARRVTRWRRPLRQSTLQDDPVRVADCSCRLRLGLVAGNAERLVYESYPYGSPVPVGVHAMVRQSLLSLGRATTVPGHDRVDFRVVGYCPGDRLVAGSAECLEEHWKERLTLTCVSL